MKARLVGLGDTEEKCYFTGKEATGYIEIDNEEYAVHVASLGSGGLGDMIELPGQWRKKLYGDWWEENNTENMQKIPKTNSYLLDIHYKNNNGYL